MGMSVDDILEHHGIKGMRWGVRKEARIRRRNAKAARLYTPRVRSPEEVKTHDTLVSKLKESEKKLKEEVKAAEKTDDVAAYKKAVQRHARVRRRVTQDMIHNWKKHGVFDQTMGSLARENGFRD